MRIFILNPNLFTGKLSKIARQRQPLDLAYIASLLRKKHQIKLLDANALSLTLDKTIDEIKDFAPEILILTSTPIDRWEVPSHEHVKLLIKNILQIINSIKISHIILTGAHGTVMPEYMLKNSRVNYVVRGEPELTTYNLVRAIVNDNDVSQIKGVSYLKSGLVINNPSAERIKNLDDLPLPAYDLLAMEKYSYTFPDIPKPFSIMLSSRGCPFNCTYCLKAMMPKIYVARSPQNVVNEIKYLVEKFNIQGMYFQDWEFLINQKRVAEICDLILQNPELLGIKWGCNARAPDINDEIAKKMKCAGCVRINIGFESGSQKVLDMADKKIKMSEVQNAIDTCKKHHINIGIYSILNLPGENRKTIAETEKFLADNNLQTMCAPNLPIAYIGTPLYNTLCQEKGKQISWHDLEKYAGKLKVHQPPWLACIFRWHYKYKYNWGNWYFLKPKFYNQFVKLIKSKL